jgi:branched-chain amino acid transport system substrate-binding protein
MMTRIFAAAALTAMCIGGSIAPEQARAQGPLPLRVGVVTDLSGVNMDYGGPTAVVAAQMAAEDVGGVVLGRKVEVLALDHQNKADVASQKVRQWFDKDHVEMVTELLNSAVALAVSKIAAEKNRIAIVVGAVTSRLTGEDCNANTIHYAIDTYALSNGTTNALLKRGGKSWYFLTADFSFGHSLEQDAISFLKKSGGSVLGASRHPAFQGVDFSSYILQAQASGADVLGLANSSNDTVNAVKAAAEFGVTPNQKLAALLMQISDVHGLGLKQSQGLYFTDGWYWNLNNDTRAFGKRFFERTGRMPGMVQAGVYSATLQYLKAVARAGSSDSALVLNELHRTTINDVFAKGGTIRPDGRMVHDVYLAQVKTPEQSHEAWDYYNIVETIPGEKAFLPLEQSKCPLLQEP